MRLQSPRSSSRARLLVGLAIAVVCAGAAGSVGALPVAAAPRADLVLTGSATPSLVFANGSDTVTYTLTVSNSGPSAAQSVTLADPLPAGLISSSWCRVTSTVDCSQNTQFVSPWPGSLPLGNVSSGVETVVIKAVASSTLRHAGTFVNSPNVSATNATTRTITLSTAYHTVPDAPVVRAFPGNGNAVVTWTAPNDGGEPITQYRLTTIPVSPAGSATTQTFTDPQTLEIPDLTVGATYRFTVEAVNAVGTSDAGSSATIAISADKSAKIIGALLRQQTGTGDTASSTDHEIAIQQFAAGTNGIGTLEETGVNAATFCGGAPCLDLVTVVNKLQDPVISGRFLVTTIYDKTVAKGTGVSFTAYYSTNPDATTGIAIGKCPKVVTANTPPCVTQLTRDGQNEDLKAVISYPGTVNFTDPKNGLR